MEFFNLDLGCEVAASKNFTKLQKLDKKWENAMKNKNYKRADCIRGKIEKIEQEGF